MSLNETYEALVLFSNELRTFDERLRVDHAELVACHEEIDHLWQDKLRREYDVFLGELESQVSRYVSGHSGEFEKFLQMKLSQLSHYLHEN